MFRTLGADYGGAYLPEALVPAAEAVAAAFIEAWPDPAFRAEYADLLATYAGRPTPLTTCRRLSAELGVRVLLKREDLAHTGSHKINNVLGQALLARRMGRTRLIAETGAGQHGVATATAAALFGMGCTVYRPCWSFPVQAARVSSRRERWVVRRGSRMSPLNQASRRMRLRAVAMMLCSRRVLASPR